LIIRQYFFLATLHALGCFGQRGRFIGVGRWGRSPPRKVRRNFKTRVILLFWV